MGKDDEKKSSTIVNYEKVQFDWIQLSADLDPATTETFLGKCRRKFEENPFVPVGAFGAVGALSYGLYTMWLHDHRKSQLAMRARVGFQGFAVASLIIGFLYKADNPKAVETAK